MYFRVLLLLFIFLIWMPAFAGMTQVKINANACDAFSKNSVKNSEPWSVLFYWGKMTNNNLGQVMRFDFSATNDSLYSIEFGHQLSLCNPMRRYFQPVFSTIEVMANFTLLNDDVYGKIAEVNPYLAFRWTRFPWNNVFCTTFAIGEGVSYVTKVPYTELHNSDSPKQLLNFLLFETTFGFPRYPCWELVLRIHHRSGAFGLYHANNSGSTAVGVGLRYRF